MEITLEQVYNRRDEHHRLAEEYGAAEGYLNEGSGSIGDLPRDTAAATRTLSCGTNDSQCNKVRYLQEALDLLESFLRRDTHRKDLNLFQWNVLLPHEAGEGNAGLVGGLLDEGSG